MVIDNPYDNKPLELEEKPKRKFLGFSICLTWTKWNLPLLSFKIIKG